MTTDEIKNREQCCETWKASASARIAELEAKLARMRPVVEAAGTFCDDWDLYRADDTCLFDLREAVAEYRTETAKIPHEKSA